MLTNYHHDGNKKKRHRIGYFRERWAAHWRDPESVKAPAYRADADAALGIPHAEFVRIRAEAHAAEVERSRPSVAAAARQAVSSTISSVFSPLSAMARQVRTSLGGTPLRGAPISRLPRGGPRCTTGRHRAATCPGPCGQRRRRSCPRSRCSPARIRRQQKAEPLNIFEERAAPVTRASALRV